jgi:hypothetical protein
LNDTLSTEATAMTAVADLIVVRYALPNSTPKRVREDIGKLVDGGLSAAQFDELRRELSSAGFLAKGARKAFTLTESGRARALIFLSLSELPPRMTWKTVVARHLFPKAAGLPEEAAARLDSADKLAAHVLKQKYGLPSGAGSSVNKVLEALSCQELGFPEETTLAGLLRAVLSKFLGASERLTKEQLAKQVPLFNTGLKSMSADAIRCKTIQDWLAASSRSRPDNWASPEQLDLPAFAATVQALAAASSAEDRFYDNKVFISALWRASQHEPNFPRLGLPEFKQRLVEANAKGLLHLSRADLVQAMNPRLVAESETTYLNATFHFVLLEEARQ